MKQTILALLTITLITACQRKQETTQTETTAPADTLAITRDAFGKLPNGQLVDRYTLRNKNGIEMQVINYGGIITSLRVPDRNGKFEDVVLGYDSLSWYLKSSPYFGAIVGRYGNRIANGKFTLDSQSYLLAQNNNGQHLHGGVQGFDKVYWDIDPVVNDDGQALKLTYNSKDMEQGYPGNLEIEVYYLLTNSNELKFQYKAITDKKTIINLTQHSYFNLTGDPANNILNNELQLNSNQFVPVDEKLIPLAKLRDVNNSPFDFRKPKKIGSDINANDQQLTFGLGYDHCWVLGDSGTQKFAGSLYDSLSGRLMEIFTTEPGIQFYSGNFLDGTLIGKKGVPYSHRHGLCLETEHFPDSPNRTDFPSVVLNPGEEYKTQTIYKFTVR